MQRDEYLLFADFDYYVEAQKAVSEVYKDQTKWTKMAIYNVARMGFFSTDRTMKEYADDIWKIEPTEIKMED